MEGVKAEVTGTQAIVNWKGLWYTDEGYFVEVVEDKPVKPKAFILQEDGSRFIEVVIDPFGNTGLGGKLSIRRRGDEKYVDGSLNIMWRTPRENRIQTKRD